MYKMTVHELVGRLNVPTYGDENGILAPKGLSARATTLYNLGGGRQNRGCVVIETPHPIDDDMALYMLVK